VTLVCPSCARGFYFECGHPPPSLEEEPLLADIPGDSPPVEKERFARKDVTVSAGRKRAAVLFPIDQSKPCEWRGLANCGGGLEPIVGCVGGYQKHRHHGPVKNTTNNEENNIHRICHRCHNQWHALNDNDYDEELFATLPHKPREATPLDQKMWIDRGYKL
jgi:hypothetical protein